MDETTNDNLTEITQVTLRVREQTGEEMFFKVKSTTKMQKIFDSYAQRRGVSVDTVTFLLDGQKINANETPKTLELEDDDQIDAVLAQVGGGDTEIAELPITIKVRDQSGEEMFFKVKKGTAMKKIMQTFAERKGVSVESLRFSIDGERVNEGDTPKMLEMEDGDQIDVLLTQLGGGLDGNNDTDETESDKPISLKVTDQAGEEMVFKVKKTTLMKKIMQAYADRKGIQMNAIKFNYDSVRIGLDDTPKMLEMQDGDEINVFTDQKGGIQK